MPVILLTRPENDARRFAEALRARLGPVETVIAPLMAMEWCGSLPGGSFTPVFTSRNGVEGFLRARGQPNGPCWCVGDATADKAQEAGFDARSASGDADALVSAIIATGETGPFLHVRGAVARGEVVARLRAAGCEAEEAVLYRQVVRESPKAALTLGQTGQNVIVPLFSPRSAEAFTEVAGGAQARLHIVAMSDAVAEAAAPIRAETVRCAATPDAAAMIEEIAGLFAALLRVEGAAGAK